MIISSYLACQMGGDWETILPGDGTEMDGPIGTCEWKIMFDKKEKPITLFYYFIIHRTLW